MNAGPRGKTLAFMRHKPTEGPVDSKEEVRMLRRLAFIVLLSFGAATLAAEPHPVVSYSRKARFDDVRDDLKAAIEAKGLVIDYQSYINNMVERTGKDLGSTRKIYVDAQAFVFCSAALSRRTMEADAANVAMCPYAITVYTTVQDAATVHVAYRRPWRPDGSPASKAALKEVEALLDGVARASVGLK
jgi:hypothetical protein